MKKILVTGATGYIGNHVVKELLKTNNVIIASSSNEEKAKKMEWFSNVEYVVFDFNKFDDSINYNEYFSKADIVVHLAWFGLPNYKSSFHLDENLPANFSFLNNLVKNGVKDITVTGTCLEYGMKDGCLDETMITKPDVCYAIAKDTLRKRLQELQKQYLFNLKWVRLFYSYGEGQSPKSLFSQLDEAIKNNNTVFNMSKGDQKRDYLRIELMAKYIVQIALQQNVEGIINCCSGAPVTVKQMVEDYLNKKKKYIKLNLGYYTYPDYEPFAFWGDTKKLKQIINE